MPSTVEVNARSPHCNSMLVVCRGKSRGVEMLSVCASRCSQRPNDSSTTGAAAGGGVAVQTIQR